MSLPSSSSSSGVKAWSSPSSWASPRKRRTRCASLGASADTAVQRYDECRIDAKRGPGDALLPGTTRRGNDARETTPPAGLGDRAGVVGGTGGRAGERGDALEQGRD